MQMDAAFLREPDFWSKAWKESRKLSQQRRIRRGKEAMEYWNKMAPGFGKSSPKQAQERLQKVMGILTAEGMLTPETEVLDVGCGTGRYALPLAGKVRQVVALDGAAEMCRLLKERAAKAGLQNINVLQRMWEDIDLEKEGLDNRFDLVFASMTPAVSDVETLLKLNQASRRHCCFIAWAEGSYSRLRQELLEHVLQENIPERGYYIIYVFNLLYSMGYFPTMRYLHSSGVRKQTEEEAVEGLTRFLWFYMEITPKIEDIVAKFVRERSVGGIVTEESRARLGVMTWRVDGQSKQ
ncbi:MAG: methyltransferase domain-containing protein [Firmicutes bacterium]|nr:methyltransferase domain-containing protein [Bacillota bacterium]